MADDINALRGNFNVELYKDMGTKTFYGTGQTPGTSKISGITNTTAKTIYSYATTTAAGWGTTTLPDNDKYDYLIKWTATPTYQYTESMTGITHIVSHRIIGYQYVDKRPSNYVNSVAGNFNNTTYSSLTNLGVMYYRTSANVDTYSATAAYGFYYSLPTISVTAGAATATPTIRINRPLISARASNTYLPVAAIKKIDDANTTLEINVSLYRCKSDNSYITKTYKELVSSINAQP